MSTSKLSAYDPETVPDAGKMRFGIVVADWNHEVTSALLDGATTTLKKHGATEKNIVVRHVRSLELTLVPSFWPNMMILIVICLGYNRRNAAFQLYMPGVTRNNLAPSI
jgi:6,7-dimethyl-8-ribityllumazine synthase